MVKLANYSIEIAESVLNDLEVFKQDSSKAHESGGILLGYVVKKDGYIRITKISIPCNKDKSSPISFHRDADNAQKIINREFDDSEGKIIYLGEWHTHSEKRPTPSSVDICMIKRHHKVSVLNQNILLLLIKGIEDIYIASYDGNKLISSYY